jgi:hypothetical protein
MTYVLSRYKNIDRIVSICSQWSFQHAATCSRAARAFCQDSYRSLWLRLWVNNRKPGECPIKCFVVPEMMTQEASVDRTVDDWTAQWRND